MIAAINNLIEGNTCQQDKQKKKTSTSDFNLDHHECECLCVCTCVCVFNLLQFSIHHWITDYTTLYWDNEIWKSQIKSYTVCYISMIKATHVCLFQSWNCHGFNYRFINGLNTFVKKHTTPGEHEKKKMNGT